MQQLCFSKVIAKVEALYTTIPSGKIWQIDVEASPRWHKALILAQVTCSAPELQSCCNRCCLYLRYCLPCWQHWLIISNYEWEVNWHLISDLWLKPAPSTLFNHLIRARASRKHFRERLRPLLSWLSILTLKLLTFEWWKTFRQVLQSMRPAIDWIFNTLQKLQLRQKTTWHEKGLLLLALTFSSIMLYFL